MKYLCKGNQLIYQTDANTLPRGEGFYFLEMSEGITRPIIVDGKIVQDESIDLPKVLKDLYDEMVKDIYDKMFIVFGTKNDVSASAFAATWEAMKSRPANYVDIDLGFVDEVRVIEYANTKLQQADEYAKFRMKRITQYELAKGGINV